ncbi:hypothetical protein [Amycolatopsis alba]|uniref:Uncharacterized protein n=1 Tax=Amycolatopsis alba DSM 44262 TaxID=1125972 RepID=A0A229R8U4_AMYAL|nr:hypothetical protein [Amycolatopsis alba]OXM43057.1 hypothetical protein CFP75_40150 [Amycolatopsis alba DSM 44262]
MAPEPIPVDDTSLAGPLATVEIRRSTRSPESSGATTTTLPDGAEQPLALRALRPAPRRELPVHSYDPVLQVAVDTMGRPLTPNMDRE